MLKASFITHDPGFYNNQLFAAEVVPQMHELREGLLLHGIQCSTFDVCPPEQADFFVVNRLDLVFGLVIQALKRNPQAILILLAWEEPVVCGLHEEDILLRLDVDRVFCWRDDLAGRKNIIKINIPQAVAAWPTIDHIAYADRKLLVAIDGYKFSNHPNECYSLRRKMLVNLVSAGIQIDLYGRGWDSCNDPVLRGLWRGEVQNKYALQCKYRFTLCIQNARDYPGDICEKIFDAFKTGSIPIYHGAPNITDHVPPECFIDLRDMRNPEVLVQFIKEFSLSDYERMRKAAVAFMQNGFKENFTGLAVANIVGPDIIALEHAGVKIRNHILWAVFILLTVFLSLRKPPRFGKWISLLYMCRSLARLQRYPC